MESGYTYPERSASDSSFIAEVSRSHNRIGNELLERVEVSRISEGRNVKEDE